MPKVPWVPRSSLGNTDHKTLKACGLGTYWYTIFSAQIQQVNILGGPKNNGYHIAENIFKYLENLIQILLKHIPQIDSKSTFVEAMASLSSGTKPLPGGCLNIKM